MVIIGDTITGVIIIGMDQVGVLAGIVGMDQIGVGEGIIGTEIPGVMDFISRISNSTIKGQEVLPQ